MKTKSRRKAETAILAYGVVVVSLIFFILPMAWITYTSFRTQPGIFTGKIFSPAKDYTLQNFRTILSVTDFPRYFLNSVEIGSIVTLFSLFCSIVGAYGLSRFDIKGKNALIAGIFSTQMFPQVLLIIPMYLVIFSLSLLDKIVGVVLGQMILVLPFQVWMLKGYFDNIPVDLDEAARIDGANIAQRLLRIVLPVAAPGIAVAAFYSFVVSWGDYLIVSIISQS
jgi:ABC-type glycerol-3-phosphate transport system permease component